MTLGGYNQAIAGLDNAKTDSSVRSAHNDRYKNIIATITSDQNFYRMLMTAQQKERNAYYDYNAKEDDADDDDTHHQPLGSNGGGSTGFRRIYS